MPSHPYKSFNSLFSLISPRCYSDLSIFCVFLTGVPFPELCPLDAGKRDILYFYGTFHWRKSLLVEPEEKRLSHIYRLGRPREKEPDLPGDTQKSAIGGKKPKHVSFISL